LLELAKASGAELRVVGGKLQGRGNLPPELRAEIVAHRAELIEALTAAATVSTLCTHCGAANARVEMGDHTDFVGQILCRSCGDRALWQIAGPTASRSASRGLMADTEDFLRAVRRSFPGAQIVNQRLADEESDDALER
jgi:hypothetical protein